jgi:hypothetical protein
MTDDKPLPAPNERPEPAKPGLLDPETRASEVSVPAERGQSPAPGRRPLFRI